MCNTQGKTHFQTKNIYLAASPRELFSSYSARLINVFLNCYQVTLLRQRLLHRLTILYFCNNYQELELYRNFSKPGLMNRQINFMQQYNWQSALSIHAWLWHEYSVQLTCLSSLSLPKWQTSCLWPAQPRAVQPVKSDVLLKQMVQLK